MNGARVAKVDFNLDNLNHDKVLVNLNLKDPNIFVTILLAILVNEGIL